MISLETGKVEKSVTAADLCFGCWNKQSCDPTTKLLQQKACAFYPIKGNRMIINCEDFLSK